MRRRGARACCWRSRPRVAGSATVHLKVETDRFDHVDAVRRRPVRVALGPARPRAPDRRAHHARARAPSRDADTASACCSRIRAGPGGSGVDFLRDASVVFQTEILKAFDIVSWDPRGVGQERAGRLRRRSRRFYAVDRDPTTPARGRRRTSRRRRRSSPRANATARPSCRIVSTAATAHDIDAIRAAMGEDADQLLRLLVRHVPRHAVRRRVPAARPRGGARRRDRPALSYRDSTLDQAIGLRARARRLLRLVRPALGVAGSRSGGDPRGRVRRAAARRSPPSRSPATSTASRARSVRASSTSASRARCTTARRGTRAWVRRSRKRRGARATACSDSPTSTPAAKPAGSTRTRPPRSTRRLPRRARAADDRRASNNSPTRAPASAPHFGATTAWLGLPCTFWPVPAESKPAPVHAPGAPPILVVGNTNDPATPYAWAQSLARQLQVGPPAHVRRRRPHRRTGAEATASTRPSTDYLLDLTVPPAGTTCR